MPAEVLQHGRAPPVGGLRGQLDRRAGSDGDSLVARRALGAEAASANLHRLGSGVGHHDRRLPAVSPAVGAVPGPGGDRPGRTGAGCAFPERPLGEDASDDHDRHEHQRDQELPPGTQLLSGR